MLYLYDRAISDDLKKSFNPYNVPNPTVSVVEPDAIIDIAAQLQDDKISFPIVAVSRNPDTGIDTERTNFTRIHKGVQAVLDPVTNNLYYEKALPINLRYALTVLTTNTADTDELVRELLFKYAQMYFLTIQLPYEADRKIRFGITLDLSQEVERKSGQLEYLKSGQIYQTIIPLRCEGCVMVHYTPAHLRRTAHEIAVDDRVVVKAD